MDNLKQSKFLISLANISGDGYQVKIENGMITLTITDRLLNQEELMSLFELLYIYGYREEKLAYSNLRYIEESPVGELFQFRER